MTAGTTSAETNGSGQLSVALGSASIVSRIDDPGRLGLSRGNPSCVSARTRRAKESGEGKPPHRRAWNRRFTYLPSAYPFGLIRKTKTVHAPPASALITTKLAGSFKNSHILGAKSAKKPMIVLTLTDKTCSFTNHSVANNWPILKLSS
jgi:hypothetical protein